MRFKILYFCTIYMFGVHLLILYFKFQFSRSIKSSTFHIFLNVTYSFRKKSLSLKFPKITQKFTQNRQTVVNKIRIGIKRCPLKRDRDIGRRKAVLSPGRNLLSSPLFHATLLSLLLHTIKIINDRLCF